MTDQMKAATIRAIYGAIILTGVDFFSTLAATDNWRIIAATCGGSFFGYMALRGIAEGLIDSRRGPTAADVGQAPKTP